ncbi:MAG TPA: hypothetical protein VK171_16745 [Fimbriimonas sp.]|nr:hypothetical protein [Fimbriimonas sp.]
MLIPMLIGYVLGGAGIYFLLTRFAPVVAEDPVDLILENGGMGETEVIELFPQEHTRVA